MLKYCTKRILLAILTIFIVAAITFFAMNAIPGGPFNKEKATSEAAKAVLEARFNLDKPVGEQFILYLKNLMHGALAYRSRAGATYPRRYGARSACRPNWAAWRPR